MTHILMFPEVFIQLQEELHLHKDLQQLMLDCEDDSFTARLGFLAGLLEVAIDGYYNYSEVEQLCHILIRRMQEKRVSIVLPFTQPLLAATVEEVEAVVESSLSTKH